MYACVCLCIIIPYSVGRMRVYVYLTCAVLRCAIPVYLYVPLSHTCFSARKTDMTALVSIITAFANCVCVCVFVCVCVSGHVTVCVCVCVCAATLCAHVRYVCNGMCVCVWHGLASCLFACAKWPQVYARMCKWHISTKRYKPSHDDTKCVCHITVVQMLVHMHVRVLVYHCMCVCIHPFKSRHAPLFSG
jgi:hypothetical protein